MTKPNSGFFRDQGNVTLRLFIRSGQFSFLTWLRFHPGPSYLQVSRKLIKTDQIMLMALTKSDRGFFCNQGRGNSMINEQIWPVFELLRDFIHAHFIGKFQEHLIKTGVMVVTSPIVSMGLCGCHSNQDFH